MSDAKMIVVESPLAGDTQRNRRFAAFMREFAKDRGLTIPGEQ